MIPFLHVHALVVPLQVCFSHEFSVTVGYLARKRIFSTLVMRFHMCLVVIAPAEELSASPDLALKVCFFSRSQAAELPPWPRAPLLLVGGENRSLLDMAAGRCRVQGLCPGYSIPPYGGRLHWKKPSQCPRAAAYAVDVGRAYLT